VTDKTAAQAELDRLKALIEKSGLEEVKATKVEYARDGRGRPGSPVVVDAGTMLSPKGEVERFKRETEMLQKLAKERRRVVVLEAALRQIQDIAHENSTGPAVPDTLWEIRNIAQGVL
jgi:hypothetical protein